jgi:hypothetical protein
MSELTKRPWWNPHALAWVVGTISLVAIAWRNAFSIMGSANHEIFWSGGWPWIFLEWRTAGDPFFPESVDVYQSSFAANIGAWCMIVAGSSWTASRCCVAWNIYPRFSLAAAFAVTACVACYITLTKTFLGARALLHHLDAFLVAVSWAAIILAWLAFFDLLAIAWSRTTWRRRDS